MLRSARVRREQYVGTWFPEPLVSDPYEDPARAAELADSVSMAALLLLEQLTPAGACGVRAARSLRVRLPRDRGVRRAVGGGLPPARRPRPTTHGRRTPRFEADRREREELAARFFDAIRDGDVDSLRELLAADVEMIGDSGGKAPQWSRGVHGADNVSRVLGSMIPLFLGIGGTLEPHVVNGQPGAIFRDRAGLVMNTWALDVLDGRIQAIRTVLNPDKLGHVGPVADAWAVLREAQEARRPR